MIASSLEHIKVAGIAAAVPERKVYSEDYGNILGEATVKKIIEKTGVQECFHAHEKQAASDLAYSAAKQLLAEKKTDPLSIGVLLFVSSCADYNILPSSAMVLQKRLNIPTNCIVFDINLSCSGFIYGLQTAASLLRATSAQKALVLVGDTISKIVSPYDTSRILFGDAGAAALLEKTTEDVPPMQFGMRSDGNRFQSIIVPAGGFRNPKACHEYSTGTDGKYRSDYQLYMNGMDVFNFAMTDVPKLFNEFEEYFNVAPADADILVLHQANRDILNRLVKKLHVSPENVPLSIERYGNTTGASVPVTLCDAYGGRRGVGVKKIMACGFGVGLSWGIATFTMDMESVLPVIHTNDFYLDELIERSLYTPQKQ